MWSRSGCLDNLSDVKLLRSEMGDGGRLILLVSSGGQYRADKLQRHSIDL